MNPDGSFGDYFLRRRGASLFTSCGPNGDCRIRSARIGKPIDGYPIRVQRRSPQQANAPPPAVTFNSDKKISFAGRDLRSTTQSDEFASDLRNIVRCTIRLQLKIRDC